MAVGNWQWRKDEEKIVLNKEARVWRAFVLGGEGGIRTLEGFNTLPAFQASALDQLCDLSI